MALTYDNQLEALIYDCGGPERVAEAAGLSNTAIWGWIGRGHIPLTDIRGLTQYSELLEGMQRNRRMHAVDIRRIGLRL